MAWLGRRHFLREPAGVRGIGGADGKVPQSTTEDRALRIGLLTWSQNTDIVTASWQSRFTTPAQATSSVRLGPVTSRPRHKPKEVTVGIHRPNPNLYGMREHVYVYRIRAGVLRG